MARAGASLAAAALLIAAGMPPAPARAQAQESAAPLAAPALGLRVSEALADEAREALEAADRALIAAADDRARRVAATRAGAAVESTLEAMRESLRRSARLLSALEARAEEAQAAGQASVARLASLARAPLAAQAAQPAGPLAAARGAWLAAAMGPERAGVAAARRQELAEAQARDRERRRAWSLARGAALDLRNAREDVLAPGGVGALRASLRETRRALDAFLAVPAPADPLGLPPMRPDRPGGWPLPAPGPIVTPFGARDALGQAQTGIEIAVPGWATPRSPALASVRYAGPLGGRGQAVALEPAPGRLLILGGLESLSVREGDIVPAGARLGQLRVIDPASPEILVAAPFPRAAFSAAMLYVEAREAGIPVNPDRWFALPKGESETP
ncbi:MAG: murein hydrolase activator EnvC family protein [Albimonas sp.]|uniref:murein hydrolase activator EnvC family protein n=1 Tax=Albimonas sp. TaxID=1872425 RepID=UPI004055C9A2